MADHTWSFELNGIPHTVRLFHGYWTGRVRLWADGKLIENSRQWSLIPRPRHPFQIDGHHCTAIILTNGYVYYYRLFIDDLPVPSNLERARGERGPKWTRSTYDVQWKNLGAQLGLEYWPDLEAQYDCRHRLIGMLDGYLSVLHAGFVPEKRSQRLVSVIVRHENIENAQNVTAQLQHDSELQQLFHTTRPLSSKILAANERYATIILRFTPEKEPIQTLAEQVRTFIRAVARYAGPTPNDRCDECGLFKPLQIAVANGFPLRLCANDLERLSHVGHENKRLYAKAPSRLGRGVLAGAGAMLLGSLVWAIALVLLNAIAAAFAMVAFVLVVQAMDKVGTKRTGFSLLVAAVLTIGGVVLGTYLGLVGYLVWHNHAQLTPGVLWRLALALPGSRLLSASLFYGVSGVLLYLFVAWFDQRRELARVFQPRIEVLKQNE